MKRNYQVIMNSLVSSYNFATSPLWQPVTSTVPAFATGIVSLGAQITQIQNLIGPQTQNLTGFTQHKHDLIADVALKSMVNIRPVLAYAVVNDQELYGQLLFGTGNKRKYSPSLIKKMKQTLIVPSLMTVHDVILAKLPAITAWGVTSVTATTLVNMKNALTALSTYFTVPRNMLSGRVLDTLKLDQLVVAANTYTRTVLDPLVESFFITNNDFYNMWFINRRQINVGGRHTRLVAVVVDELNQPFVNVTVQVDELQKDGRTFKAVSGTTDINGTTVVEEFEQGNRTVTVSGDGMVTKTFGPFYFEHGKGLLETFTCEPAFSNLPASKTNKEKVNN